MALLAELLAAARAPATPWLAAFAGLAGLVRGFTGFGAGLVFMPLAATVAPPVTAVVLLQLVDVPGTLPLLPKALKRVRRAETGLLVAGYVAALPAGLWLLARAEPDGFRVAVAVICAVSVLVLASGWRYRSRPAAPVTLAVGGASGFLGGFASISGPPVILYLLGSARGAAEVRAGLIVFFSVTTAITLGSLAVLGHVTRAMLVTALLVVIPYALAGLLGARLFRLAGERNFRYLAYATVGAAALLALPVWDGR